MKLIQRLAVMVLLPVLSLYGQNTPLTRDQVIQMSKAGLSDDIIVARIKAQSTPMNLTTDDLIALKGAGVSDPVIRAIAAGPAVDPPAVGSARVPVPAANPDDPMAPHDPGIYLMVAQHNGGKKMVELERVGAGHEKTTGVLGHAFSAGIAKAKIKAEIPGPRAEIRVTESKPVFYMYFPPSGNLGATETISNPSQFALLSLEEKKDHRETAVLKIGFANASGGTDKKRTYEFKAEKMQAYAYRVIPETLDSGEFAFVASTGMGTNAAVVIYDFGVDLK